MRSDNVRKGMQQAPHRSLFHALGMAHEEMDKPMVGIVSSYNEIVPGHMNIDKIVDAVKLGVAEAGGVPVVFPADPPALSQLEDQLCDHESSRRQEQDRACHTQPYLPVGDIEKERHCDQAPCASQQYDDQEDPQQDLFFAKRIILQQSAYCFIP